MIRLSRFESLSLARPHTESRMKASFPWWHVGCTLLLAGCFNVEGPWPGEQEVNTPPTIDSPMNWIEGEAVQVAWNVDLQSDPLVTYLQVAASDEDGDDLSFSWVYPPNNGCCEPQDQVTNSGSGNSALFITLYEEVWDDLERDGILARVDDGSETVTVSWDVTIQLVGVAE